MFCRYFQNSQSVGEGFFDGLGFANGFIDEVIGAFIQGSHFTGKFTVSAPLRAVKRRPRDEWEYYLTASAPSSFNQRASQLNCTSYAYFQV